MKTPSYKNLGGVHYSSGGNHRTRHFIKKIERVSNFSEGLNLSKSFSLKSILSEKPRIFAFSFAFSGLDALRRMLEGIHTNYTCIFVELGTDTTQESKTTTYIEYPQLIFSLEWKRSKGISKHDFTVSRIFLDSVDVE